MIQRTAVVVLVVAALCVLLILLPAVLDGAPDGDPGVPPVQLREEATPA